MKKLLNDQSGMTLIDVALALLVVSLLLTPAITSYHNWKIMKDRGATQKSQRAITKAIEDYYFTHDYTYPCPANPALAPNNANYGKGAKVITPTVVGGVTVNITSCATVLRTADGLAYIGSLPFSDLLLPTNASFDAYSNKFTYAVSAALVEKTTFNNPATLTVSERDCMTMAPKTDLAPAHYIVVSHGENGIGARTAHGVSRQVCPAPGSNAEAENCDGDSEFVSELCMVSDRQGTADFYDDITSYIARTPPTRIWAESPADYRDIMTNVAKVGINNLNPQFNLDVVGNIKTTKTLANEICDPGNPANPAADANCFNPSLIGGDEPDMDCANNTEGATIMTGIGSAKAKCNISHTLPATNCAANGRYIVGIAADGEIICGS